MDPIRPVQYDGRSNRHYVRFEGCTYQGLPVTDICVGERVTVVPLGIGVLVRSATHRETWYPEAISCVEAGNNGAADFSDNAWEWEDP